MAVKANADAVAAKVHTKALVLCGNLRKAQRVEGMAVNNDELLERLCEVIEQLVGARGGKQQVGFGLLCDALKRLADIGEEGIGVGQSVKRPAGEGMCGKDNEIDVVF